MAQSWAQGVEAVVENDVVVTDEDTQLEDGGATQGFGLVVQNWIEDFQERFTNNPDLIVRSAERALDRVDTAAADSDEKAAARFEKARERYEKKMAKLEGVATDLSENKKTELLEKLAKHEAVLEGVYERAPAAAAAGLERALENAAKHREKMLEKFAARKDALEERLDARRAAIKERIDQRRDVAQERKAGVKDVVDERKLKLLELRDEWKEKRDALREDGSELRDGLRDRRRDAQDNLQGARSSFKERLELDKANAKEKAAEARLGAREKFTNRVNTGSVTGTVEAVDAVGTVRLDSAGIRAVQGAIDYQPEGFWEKFGYGFGSE